VVLRRVGQQDGTVDTERKGKQQRAFSEAIAPTLAHDEEANDSDSNEDVERSLHRRDTSIRRATGKFETA
jgi:hypothetical protein